MNRNRFRVWMVWVGQVSCSCVVLFLVLAGNDVEDDNRVMSSLHRSRPTLERGWPFVFATSMYVHSNYTGRDETSIHWGHLLLDLCIAALLIGAILYVTRGGQITLRAAILAMVGVAIPCAHVAHHMQRHAGEAAFGQVEANCVEVRREYVGPVWWNRITQGRVNVPAFRSIVEVVVRSDVELEKVAQHLPKLRHLRTLGYCPERESSMASIDSMEPMHGIELLNNSLGGDKDNSLVILKKLPDLKTLDLSFCNVRGPGLDNLCFVPQLEDLDLSSNRSIDEHSLRSLRFTPELRGLALAVTPVTGSGLRDLHLPNLTTLDLELARNFEVEYLKDLTAPQLESLYLQHTKIRPTSFQGLDFPRLKRLVLDNSSNNTDFTQVDDLLQFPELEELHLALCPIHDDGVAALAQLRSLRKLNLRGTPITDASVPTLLKCKLLTHIDVRDSHITRSGVEKLRHLPALEVLITYRRYVPKEERERWKRESGGRLVVDVFDEHLF